MKKINKRIPSKRIKSEYRQLHTTPAEYDEKGKLLFVRRRLEGSPSLKEFAKSHDDGPAWLRNKGLLKKPRAQRGRFVRFFAQRPVRRFL